MNESPQIMPINIIGGDSSTGKSTLTRVFSLKPCDVIDIEGRWKNYDKKILEDITIRNLLLECLDKKTWKRDPVKVKDYIENFYKEYKTKPKSIVIDGISDLRELAIELWISYQPTVRKRPSKYEWGEVDQIVQDMILPLIWFCRFNEITLFMTSFMKPIYEKGEPTGLFTVDCLEIIKANADAIWVTLKDNGKFTLITVKHQLKEGDPIDWTIPNLKETNDDSGDTSETNEKIPIKKIKIGGK